MEKGDALVSVLVTVLESDLVKPEFPAIKRKRYGATSYSVAKVAVRVDFMAELLESALQPFKTMLRVADFIAVLRGLSVGRLRSRERARGH